MFSNKQAIGLQYALTILTCSLFIVIFFPITNLPVFGGENSNKIDTLAQRRCVQGRYTWNSTDKALKERLKNTFKCRARTAGDFCRGKFSGQLEHQEQLQANVAQSLERSTLDLSQPSSAPSPSWRSSRSRPTGVLLMLTFAALSSLAQADVLSVGGLQANLSLSGSNISTDGVPWITEEKYQSEIHGIGQQLREAQHALAMDAYEDKDYKKARELLETLVDEEDTEAQEKLAFLYCHGLGGAKDLSKAADLWERAAEVGDLNAQNNLAALYYREKKYAKAIPLLRKVADRGDPNALFNLGAAYYEGFGVNKSVKKALELWNTAARAGSPDAQGQLGIASIQKRDSVAAVQWWTMAAAQGHIPSLHNLGSYYLLEEKDYVEARKWLGEAAKGGDSDAQNKLAILLAEGKGGPQNLIEAENLWKKAVKQGHKEAKRNLSRFKAQRP